MYRLLLCACLCLGVALGCSGVSQPDGNTDVGAAGTLGSGPSINDETPTDTTPENAPEDTTPAPAGQPAGDETGTPPTDGTGDVAKILPESVRLDLAELGVSGNAAPPPSGQDKPPEPPPPTQPTSQPQDFLDIATRETDRTMNQLDEIMRRFSQINALVTAADLTQVAGTITWDTRVESGMPGPGGSRVPNPGSGTGESREIKVDFSPFDFDGDGVADGSGQPLVAPVALRVWVTDAAGAFQPAACGLISVLPTDENEGAGELLTLSYARNGDGDIARIRWSQADSADQVLETWDEHPQGGGNWGHSSFLVEHRVVEGMTEKTVKSTIDVQFVAARFLDAAKAAVVRGADGTTYEQLQSNPPALEYRDMTTREIATPEDALNVSTEDFDVLALPDVAGFNWPDDFPVTPTF
jgi:hypothetical protein